MNREQILNEIAGKIINNNLKYNNSLIIGDNAIGKTSLLNLINKTKKSLYVSSENHINYKDFNMILIDDIEIMISLSDIFNINDYLNSKYADKKLIISTHNIHLISKVKDFNIICLYNDNYLILDGNDYNSYDDARNLFIKKSATNTITLTNLLSLKTSNNWTELEDKKLAIIKNKKLNKSQKLLLNEIEKDSK